MNAQPSTPERLFAGSDAGFAIYARVRALIGQIGEVEERATKSQVTFSRRRGFAYVWRPGQYVKSEVPAVVSILLDRRLASDRVKEVAHPSPNRWMHHIEVNGPDEVDEELVGWLAEAYDLAG